VVFGGLALAASAGLLIWNRGVREGRTGTTVGKSWLGLRTRDAETGCPIGTRTALRRQGIDVLTLGATRVAWAPDRHTRADLRLHTEVVPETLAREEGFVVASGPPAEVISVELLRDVFGLDAAVVEDPVADRPLIVPIGKRHVYGRMGCEQPVEAAVNGASGAVTGANTPARPSR
jgi:hypothetical protein